MKINNVIINNWHYPGEQWWADVEAMPNDLLIEATISMTLSWTEYKELLDRNKRETDVT